MFAQTNTVDLFALIGQLKKLWGDLTVTWTMLLPFIAAGAAAYRTWGSKQVPTNSIAIQADVSPKTVEQAKGTTLEVAGKVVGALLIATLLLMPGGAHAQPKFLDRVNSAAPLTNSTCDPLTLFQGITAQNLLVRIKTCADDDLDNAIADARHDPIDYAALACLLPVQTMRSAIIKGGLLTGFQGFRRAKAMGLIAGCKNYVTSTVLLP